MTNYNIKTIYHEYNDDSAIATSIATLNKFCKDCPHAIYINATLKETICDCNWNYILSANFCIKIEGHIEKKIVKFEWKESGGLMDKIGDKFKESYTSNPCVIYQYDKWFLLEESDYYKDNEKLKLEIDKRHVILIAELNKHELEYRNNNVLCNNFINGDTTYSIEQIVHKMCKMKYLYEYCHYKDFINNCTTLKINKKEIKQKALDKYSGGMYPKCFPWITF